jgi:hypothetical protein
MAKKKENERRAYNLGKGDVVTYKKAAISRKMTFLILRGIGLDAKEVIDENQAINAFVTKQSVKVKFYLAKTEEEVIKHLKDANTWATAVAFNPGDLEANTVEIQKTIKKLLIPVKKISPKNPGSGEDYIEVLKIEIEKNRPAK